MAAVMHIARLLHAGWVIARHGSRVVPIDAQLPAPLRALARLARRRHARNGLGNEARLASALTALGPSYIKLGQFLATRDDIIGPELARDLSTLQDKLPPFSMTEARQALEEALGKPVEAVFADFGAPVAAASIAQVHKAHVREADGRMRPVAVKILRPGIEARFRKDLQSYVFAARLIERWHPPVRRLRPVAVVDTLARSVAIEMDLRMEAAAIAEMADNILGDEGFRVPQVDWSRSARRVLTLEWIDGIPLADQTALRAAGHDLKRLGAVLLQSFLRHAMRDGFFHADMHPGNLFVDADGRLVAVDFGIMGRLGAKERRFLAEILYGFITRDYTRVAQVHFEAGYVPPHHSVPMFAQALRAIGEPILDRTADEISMAQLLGQLLQYTEVFDMQTRPELLLLQKTMVVVEGVARTLDPRLNIWSTAEPVVRSWIEQHLGPEARFAEAAEGAASLGKFMGDLPRLLRRFEVAAEVLSAAGGDGLRLDQSTVERLADAQARRARSGRLALWIAALSLAVIALALVG